MYQFDPYSMLGISANADIEDIKRTYRRLAQRFHPDANPNNPGALAQFQDINLAYGLLMEPKERARYDQYVASHKQDVDSYFTLRVTPSKRAVVPMPEEQVIYLLAEIFPAPRQTDAPRKVTSLNLTLVLDHSKSMTEGARIERVKIAAHQIIEQLGEHDTVSIIIFNDRATTIIPATYVKDKASLKARVSMITPSGGTEMFQGLSAGVAENRKFLGANRVNHIILITDGHTYGDQERCLELAGAVVKEGIVISAMGMGSDWNDTFLDALATKTGGASQYINSADLVIKFLNEHVRSLTNVFADRMRLCVATDADVNLEMIFKLMPNPQPLEITDYYIPLASLQENRAISVLLQFMLPASMAHGFRTVARLVASGDILQNQQQAFQAVSDISIEITDTPTKDEPPSVIMDALSKLTLYRLQERAQEAIDSGDITEATRRLENLATRLLELGENSLAMQTLSEAQNLAKTSALSAEGRKEIKYQTRALVGSTSSVKQALSSLLTDDSNPE